MTEVAFGELLAPAFRPFVIGAIIVALIAFLEVVSAIFGLALSATLDDFLPELDLDGEADGGLLSWLGFGHAPFLVVLIVLLSVFSIAGILIQACAMSWLGSPLWPALAVIIALAISLPLCGWLSRKLSWLIPSVESSGIHRDELLGHTGRITLGTATDERTAEVEVVGPKGLRHWVRVRAERGETIGPGEQVRLLERESRSVFVARRQE